MATRYLARSLSLLASKQVFSHGYASTAPCRLRPLMAVAASSHFRGLFPGISARTFSTRLTNSSLNDQNPNWSNRPPKEAILLDGCDFEHWLVVMDPPGDSATRDEIIDGYIKTLASVVGSEEEARMKIYSVSTRYYFAFGALVSEELSYKIKELPMVREVLPDSYLDVKNEDYGGEPFINGQAVPYDPKYHRNFVRPRNFDRRGGGMQGRNTGPNAGGAAGDYGGQPNMGSPPTNGPANNAPNHQYGPGPNSGPGPGLNSGGQPGPGPYSGGAPYHPGPGPNSGGAPYQPGPDPYGGGAPYHPGPCPNSGGAPYQPGPGPYSGGVPYHPGPGPNSGVAPYQPGPGPN